MNLTCVFAAHNQQVGTLPHLVSSGQMTVKDVLRMYGVMHDYWNANHTCSGSRRNDPTAGRDATTAVPRRMALHGAGRRRRW